MTATLGQWLDVTMTNRGLRNRALAQAMGVHESAVHNWRKGKNVPQLATLQRLAAELNVDPIRLAVTAGLWEPSGVDPLPMPEPVARRAKARRRAADLLDELTTPTGEIREGGGDDATLEALNTIRKLVGEGK